MKKTKNSWLILMIHSFFSHLTPLHTNRHLRKWKNLINNNNNNNSWMKRKKWSLGFNVLFFLFWDNFFSSFSPKKPSSHQRNETKNINIHHHQTMNFFGYFREIFPLSKNDHNHTNIQIFWLKFLDSATKRKNFVWWKSFFFSQKKIDDFVSAWWF